MTMYRFFVTTLIFSSLLNSPVSAQPEFRRQERNIAKNWREFQVGVDNIYVPSEGGTIDGRVFSSMAKSYMNEERSKTVFSNKAGYDLFEAWIGITDDTEEDALSVRFIVRGDGQIIYESPLISKGDAPQKISVPIKGYSGVTLELSDWNSRRRTNYGTWAEPVFVKLIPLTSRPTNPSPNFPRQQKQDIVDVRKLYNGAFEVVVNAKRVNFGFIEPSEEAGRILLPMRPIFEALGATVNYDSANGTILASRNGREVRMRVGSPVAYINGQSQNLEVPSRVKLGTTMVPLRFVGEAFSASVIYRP